jgi:hypothetical protein
MMSWIDSTLGTVFYSMVVFMVGAMIGKPMWCWMKSKLPWSKCDTCNS